MSPKLFLLMSMLTVTVQVRSAENISASNLDSARMDHIRKLLREVPLIDGHNDLPWQYRKHGKDMNVFDLTRDTTKMKLVTDIPRLKAGGVGGQFWSVYIDPEMSGAIAVRAVLEQIDIVHQMVARYPNNFELALTSDDIERIHRKGKVASLIGMEGGHSIDNSLAMLRMTYALGARYMTLTHTKNLDWADAAGDKPKTRGLSEFGESVVHEMNRLGMMVDVSHVSDDTMAAAIKASKAPVICSHSSARALCNVPRNVPDDLLRKISETRGVVMVNFVPGFLTEKGRLYAVERQKEENRIEKILGKDEAKIEDAIDQWRKTHPAPPATLSDVADHIDHIRKIAGIDCVGIGGDYEGFGHPPLGLEDVSCYPALLAELSRRGYSDEDIQKVAGRNILRAFRATEKVSAQLRSMTE
ncbi:MAG: dipeptidase [Verrucomicrobiota bacterium]